MHAPLHYSYQVLLPAPSTYYYYLYRYLGTTYLSALTITIGRVVSVLGIRCQRAAVFLANADCRQGEGPGK